MTASFLSLSLDEQRTIDQLCIEFEDRWLERSSPDLAPLLDRAPEPLRPTLLFELIKIDATYRRRRGEAVGALLYTKQFPKHVEAIELALGKRMSEATTTIAPGCVVGRYRVIRSLGEGDFGEVFLARDEALGRDVALKTLRGNERDELLLEEARMAARLRHPRIAAIRDTGRLDDGRPFVVMEYLPGVSLRERLEEDPTQFTVAESARMVAQLAEAVDAAHRQGIIHRDLCPENILVDDEGQVAITDFGLAMHELQRHEHAGEWAGTLAYMSPEQLRGESEHLDGRADVWALGVIFFELATGKRPFGGGSVAELQRAILDREPPPLRRDGERIPKHWERAVRSCLEKSVSDRWATAGELATALSHRPQLPLARIGLIVVAALAAALLVFHAEPPKRPEVVMMINNGGTLVPLSTVRPSLQEGDDVFLELSAAAPAYFHVWWIDSTGSVRRLSNSPQTDKSKQQRLPRDPHLAWPLPKQSGGLDTLVVLATDSSRAPSLAPPPPLPRELTLTSPAWFADGRRAQPGSRAGPDGSPQMIEDPLGDWHRKLADPLTAYGEVRTITFPCEPSVDQD